MLFKYLRIKLKNLRQLLQRITHWEDWPFKLIYAPITPVWLWYIIRSGKVWFFTPSNPKLTFGGMEGEPKKEMYALLPKELYPTSFNVQPGQDFKEILLQLHQSAMEFPLIVKPEIGGQGILLRKIESEEDLQHYHSHVPFEYIVQRMVLYPMEVSIFYIRHPGGEKGIITGFLHKIPLQVCGDGQHTLQQLVKQHPKGSKRTGELFSRHKESWNKVLASGEKYVLCHAANHNRGAHFIDLKDHIDEKLVAIFDKISHEIDDFFYGRYDIMCNSVEDLKMGRNYSILEYNGCGAEPNHFYDTGYTLLGAYREILRHWKALFTISKYNRRKGVKPWPLLKGRKFLNETKRLYRLMKVVDADL